jgi:hypothetical protein
MIGQVTGKAISDIGYKYYFVFIVCNFTNAVFFWALLPETRKVPLEEMNDLFQNAPLFVAGKDMTRYRNPDLERRVADISTEKRAVSHVEI